jgi:hypothetical protein
MCYKGDAFSTFFIWFGFRAIRAIEIENKISWHSIGQNISFYCYVRTAEIRVGSPERILYEECLEEQHEHIS